MAFSYQQIIEDSWEDLQAQRASANADLESARLAEDADLVRYARNRLLEVDQNLRALNDIVVQATRPAPQQVNRNGLGADEVDVARISGISEQEYARNRARMNAMKDEGYWSQGRVFK